MALGGWRIGFCRLPDGPLGADAARALSGMASEVWSSLAAPMQHAATYVLDEPDDVASTSPAAAACTASSRPRRTSEVVAAGATCRPPTGAFYLYPDLEPLRPALARAGREHRRAARRRCCSSATTSPCSRARRSATTRRALRFRMATSLLYGRSDEAQRWEALRRRRPGGAAVDRRRAGAPRRGAPRAGGVVLRPPRRATASNVGPARMASGPGSSPPDSYTALVGVGRGRSAPRSAPRRRGGPRAASPSRRGAPRAGRRSRGSARGRRRPVGGGGQVGERLGDGPGGDQLRAHLRHVGHVAARAPLHELRDELVELRRAQHARRDRAREQACSWATFAAP